MIIPIITAFFKTYLYNSFIIFMSFLPKNILAIGRRALPYAVVTIVPIVINFQAPVYAANAKDPPTTNKK